MSSHNMNTIRIRYLLQTPKLGLLHSEHIPKTELPADVEMKNSFAGGGLSFTPVSPMQQWNISYTGKMWKCEEANKTWHNVKFEAKFTSNLPYFVVDTDSDRKALARALAREVWTKEFFDVLEKAHQTHYEQMGSITGHLTIDGEMENIELMGFRDHSFGNKRDWTLLHRYIFHMFYMDDNTRICCGVISQPCSISHFEIGYVIREDKQIHPIQECDLMLYQHGEDGNPPKQLAFSFVSNNESYDCKIEYLHDSVHYKGSDIEAKLYERFFICEVNGRKGKGISEWHYNNMNTYTKSNTEIN
ncbi:eg:bacr7a4.20 protein [Holotrichia oblita]|uniref:Eg:bacr7a4.20 protein n=1 Tax=Holotrichia oblita TaxID=644536 RepID=A0ACB9TWR4_HOLOL|nr:eg:bacr7a4.20 protein [Holotrichia oblita]